MPRFYRSFVLSWLQKPYDYTTANPLVLITIVSLSHDGIIYFHLMELS